MAHEREAAETAKVAAGQPSPSSSSSVTHFPENRKRVLIGVLKDVSKMVRKSLATVAIDALMEDRLNVTYTSIELQQLCKLAWDLTSSFWDSFKLKAEIVEASIGFASLFPQNLIGKKILH
jgi:hypothetical protein